MPRRRTIVMAAVVIVATAGVLALRGRAAPALPTAPVVRGEFIDYIEVRGEVKAARSVVLSAPMQSGELQIVRLAKNGSTVKPGEVVVEFDRSMVRRTVQEKQSELRQAEAEIEQARGQASLAGEQNRTALLKARYDVDRAKLDVAQRDIIARLDYEKFKLALADAEQRLREQEAKTHADEAAAAADAAARRRKREKVLADLKRAESALAALQLRAPAGGVVNVMPNFRAGGPFGSQQEFREGDRAWSGANVVELPDPSTLHLAARIDESDRGRMRQGQKGTLKVDAVPNREYTVNVADISVLARVDFSSGWPPPRNFDLKLGIGDRDERLRPGMSGTARVAVGKLPNVLLVPAEAVFVVGGRPVIYRRAGSVFEPVVVNVLRRGRDQAALASGVSAGDVVSLKKPAEPAGKKGPVR